MKNVILCLVVVALLPTAECSFRLCGFKLTMTLRSLCNNKFCGGGFMMKPAAPYSGPDSFGAPDYSKRTAPFYMYGPTAKRAGIATECCEKKCSMAYLKSFCCNTNIPMPPVKRTPLIATQNDAYGDTNAYDFS
uniref:IlGF domain-containing protein n=1 Tax=Panagrellus redivivus TaxID=6233 RepID=A0A7E4ZU02_PANRE